MVAVVARGRRVVQSTEGSHCVLKMMMNMNPHFVRDTPMGSKVGVRRYQKENKNKGCTFIRRFPEEKQRLILKNDNLEENNLPAKREKSISNRKQIYDAHLIGFQSDGGDVGLHWKSHRSRRQRKQ